MRKKVETNGNVRPRMAAIGAVVTFCGCTEDEKADTAWHGRDTNNRKAFPCPHPIDKSDLGVISYFHVNPIKRLIYAFRRDIMRQKMDMRKIK